MLVAKAQQQAPFHRDPNTIAGSTEVMAMGRDKAYAAIAVGHPEIARRPGRGLGSRRQRVAGFDHRLDVVAGVESLRPGVIRYIAQRHLLDETDIEAFLAGDIGFLDIGDLNRRVLDDCKAEEVSDLDLVLAEDERARRQAREWVSSRQ